MLVQPALSVQVICHRHGCQYWGCEQILPSFCCIIWNIMDEDLLSHWCVFVFSRCEYGVHWLLFRFCFFYCCLSTFQL